MGTHMWACDPGQNIYTHLAISVQTVSETKESDEQKFETKLGTKMPFHTLHYIWRTMKIRESQQLCV